MSSSWRRTSQAKSRIGAPRMGRPPEPFLQIALRPAGPAVLPEVAEELFEEVCAVDLEVEPLKRTQPQGLGRGEVPGVLQPDEPRLVHQRLVGRPLLADFIPAHLVHGIHQVTHDVELIEHQHRLGRSVLDDVDVRLPHVAADAFECRRFLRSEEVEERVEGLCGAPRPTPDQPLAAQGGAADPLPWRRRKGLPHGASVSHAGVRPAAGDRGICG